MVNTTIVSPAVKGERWPFGKPYGEFALAVASGTRWALAIATNTRIWEDGVGDP